MGDGEVFIGWAIGLSNLELGVDEFGSPREVLDGLKAKNLRFCDLARHLATQIAQTEIFAADTDDADASRLGMTPLHWAAAAGRRDVVEQLLDRGAKAELNWFMLTADQLAYRNGHVALAAWMEEKIPDSWKEWGFDDIVEWLALDRDKV